MIPSPTNPIRSVEVTTTMLVVLVLVLIDAGGAVVAGGMHDEHLGGEVGDRVDPADERPHLAAGEPLDRLAEALELGVLKELAQVTQTRVLAEPAEAVLRRRQRLLK